MRGTLRQSNESAASEPREGGQETSGATSTALLSLRALQAVNVLVILLVLAVQAPWEYLTYRSFRSFYGDGSCKVSEVFGLHKVSDASESLSLSRRGNLAEVLLFVLLRLLVIVRRTATFRSVVAVASRLELARARELLERSEAWKLKQAITAEATSKWRVQRRHRMRQLREAVMKVAYTGNPNPQELQALVSLLEGKHLNDTATAAQHRRNMSRPEALPSGAVTPTLPIQGGSVSQLRPRLRSVSVLAAGSNSNAVQRPAALEQCIKRAKLNGFTGNAHLDGCPGWDDSKREPSPSKDRFKVVRGGISKVAAGLSTMTMRYRKGATQKDPKAPQGGGAAPGHKRSRSAADGVESRAGSLARAEDWDAMGRSGKEGGSATGPGSVAGDNSEKDPKASLQRAQTRTMTDVKMMFSSEIGEPPSPFVRFGRWLMRHVRAFVKETDSRLLAACLLTGLLFTIDMGVLSAIVSASIVGYALVAERAGHAYWLAVQVSFGP